MKISMYQASAPRFANMLRNLSAILDKAQAHAEAKKIDPAVFTQSRLAPDMFPLSRQVQSACDSAKGAVARLAGVEIPRHEDTEQTFAELKARIAKTVHFVESLKPAQIDGSEERDVVLKLRGQDVKFNGLQYLLGFAYPNFYFHVTTAYNILRHNGVQIGKGDYIGNP
jgi:hypothetical protein